MGPRHIKKEDDELLKDVPWTAEDTVDLHALARRRKTLDTMADEYEKMEWLKKKLFAIFVWGLGVPTGIVYFLDPIEHLMKFIAKIRGD